MFFKKAWSVIKGEVYAAVFDFFENAYMLKQCNISTITLAPKVSNPTYAKDLRPIACCSMVYKIIAKILTSRLAKVVGEVVNDAQTGFLPGKHISDKILLVTELIKGYTWKYISPRCMIKVDLQKAYDSIDWRFIVYAKFFKPFLFALGMGYLSRCLAELKNNPYFHYHPRCEAVEISHLMFASD